MGLRPLPPRASVPMQTSLRGNDMQDIGSQIDDLRKQHGSRLLVLGHHYQRSAVLRHADEVGDSLELARKAATRGEADRIVFLGVRFMAESADILTRPDQAVYMPEPAAGCPMANMAAAGDMEAAWARLQKARPDGWLPVVYVNSTAEIKARCGRWGGSTCTSSNARTIFESVLSEGKGVFFLPDEHLGVNSAHDLGIADDRVLVYDSMQVDGGLRDEQVAEAEVVAWKGFCLVHTAFTVQHVKDVRLRLPSARIIVHPETPKEVVRLVDAHGSTSQIIKFVESAPDGSTVVIGTEVNLVERLAEQHKNRVTVKALSPSVCANMARTNEQNLLDVLTQWPDGCRVRVPTAVADDARKALDRMLAS